MDERTLRALEFPRVLERLSAFCLSEAGKEAALGAKALLEERDMLSGWRKIGGMKFFVTDKVEGFAKLGKDFLGEELSDVTRVEIEEL